MREEIEHEGMENSFSVSAGSRFGVGYGLSSLGRPTVGITTFG